MSDSYHITMRTFAGNSKSEIDAQARDPDSDFSTWAKRNRVKRNEIGKRRAVRLLGGEGPGAVWDEGTEFAPEALKPASESP